MPVYQNYCISQKQLILETSFLISKLFVNRTSVGSLRCLKALLERRCAIFTAEDLLPYEYFF